MTFTTVGKFAPRQILVTSGAKAMLTCADLMFAIHRHLTGDWGEVDEEDKRENEQSLTRGGRLLSRFTNACGIVHWVITEADRSATTVLLPEEY
jgi:hypothetical protein